MEQVFNARDTNAEADAAPGIDIQASVEDAGAVTAEQSTAAKPKTYKYVNLEEWREAILKDEYYDILGTF
jgi:hypothetical protein